jgi:hypothetical protein
MANQSNRPDRPYMDEEKRQGGYKDQRDQSQPKKQRSDLDPDKRHKPGQQSDRDR